MGQRLAAHLAPRLKTHIGLLAIGRHAVKTPQMPKTPKMPNTHFICADLDQKKSLRRLAALPSRVIYLAPPPSSGTDDARMQQFLAAAPRTQQCIYVSTTGVYGAAAGAWVTETTPLSATEPRSQRRIAAEKRLKRSAIPHVSILRAPGIYAKDRLPIARIQAGLPAFDAADDVPTNHIHADDLARLCWLALFQGRNRRAYNAADGQPMLHADYLNAVAQHFGLNAPPRLPAAQVKDALSPIAWSMLAGARRVSSARLFREWGVQLKYPSVNAFLAQRKDKGMMA